MLTTNKTTSITGSPANAATSPETLAEVERIFIEWDRSSRRLASGFSVSRQETTPEFVRIVVSREKGFKVETKDQCLVVQAGRKKPLSLHLDKFEVNTVMESNRLSLYITPMIASPHRYLMSALSDIAETKYPAFQSRVLRAFRSLENDLAGSVLEDVLAAPTDYLAVFQALKASPVMLDVEKEDPILAAKFRGQQRKAELLEAAGKALSADDVAQILGLTRQAVDRRRSKNQLLAITAGRRGYAYPGFQFSDGKTLRGLDQVLAEMTSLDPWMQLIFFTSPNERLGGKTPIDALTRGPIDAVTQAARIFGEQGAV